MRTQASSVDLDLASATRLSEEKSFEGIGLEFAPDDAPLEESYPEDWIPLAGAGLRTTKILGGLTKKGLARLMCFPGDTPICMGGLGSKKIENIQVGDQVQSCDLRTDSCTTRSVTQVFKNTAHRLLVLSFQGKTLKATDEHPFFVMGKGWVKASDLHIGDELRHILGQNVVLEKIDQEFGEFSVYNFEVEGLHNYYACDVLVHNCNEAPHAGKILRNEVGSVGTDIGQRISSQRAMRSTQALDSAASGLIKLEQASVKTPHGLQDFAKNPLKEVRYTDKVQGQMKQDIYHGFPKEVDNFGGLGKSSQITGRDGIVRTKVELEGGYNNKDGVFEWIIEADGRVNHRLFVPKD